MRERGRDFFIMSLARELGMTRRRLLAEIDSYEMSLWDGYFRELNKPPEKKKQSPEVLASQLKNVFATRKAQKGKGKK